MKHYLNLGQMAVILALHEQEEKEGNAKHFPFSANAYTSLVHRGLVEWQHSITGFALTFKGKETAYKLAAITGEIKSDGEQV